MDPRRAFLDLPPPPNYVGGVGRGATGFTTRSDIGPARYSDPVAWTKPPEQKSDEDQDNDKQDYSDANYDEFMGYGGSFSDPTTPYDAEDMEADEVYAAIDQRMDTRRNLRREALLKQQLEQYRASRPKIQQQFVDLKRDLASVEQQEWENIPEIGDHTQRYKKKARVFYTPAPDSLLAKAKGEAELLPSIDVKEGFQTPSGGGSAGGGQTPLTDLTEVATARKNMLNVHLKKMSDSVSGQTVVDPKGYLTDLNSIKVSTDAEIGDIKKARLLLKSVITTNPKHAPGWIAAARLEEVAGQMVEARKVIMQGTQQCPDAEDVWIEAARLHSPENAKTILAKAVKQIPSSVKIWMQAAALEADVKAKKKILRKALEFCPNSVKLWKAAIELEDPVDAKVMLGRAVECVPHSVEMWLALAQLETYENARKVLNKARETIPTDPSIWISAAKLEEAHGNSDIVKAIIKRAIKSLASHQVVLDRDSWLKEAESAEKSGSIAVAQAIVKECIEIGVEEEDKKRTWKEDAESSLSRSCVNTARAIYAHALTIFPASKSLWWSVVELEKNHGSKESLESTLNQAVKSCPKAEVLWLMAAKDRWIKSDLAGARDLLQAAFAANPNSEKIWLAAVKLEHDNHEHARARVLLQKARERAPTEKVWVKSIKLEREVNNHSEERKLLEEALKKFPQYSKFWIMMGQLEESENRENECRDNYTRGLRNCPHDIKLWYAAISFEEKSSGSGKARSLLEKARLLNKKNEDLWLMAVRIELRAGNKKVAQNVMAKALQECPNSGKLWAEAIEIENQQQQKARSVEALKRCDNDPHVIVAVAKIFWKDGKIDKARTWFNRAITLDPSFGDAWAFYYKFEAANGADEPKLSEILNKAVQADPKNGENWRKISKDPANWNFKPEQILKKVAASVSFTPY